MSDRGVLAWHLSQAVRTGRRVLASGKESLYKVDCDIALSECGALRIAGQLVAEALAQDDIEAVGGDGGATPLAVAAAVVGDRRWFRVREPLGFEGARVAVVDDVLTTGGSVKAAVEACRKMGLDVVRVVVLVDREEGGLSAVRRHVPCTALFKVSELWVT